MSFGTLVSIVVILAIWNFSQQLRIQRLEWALNVINDHDAQRFIKTLHWIEQRMEEEGAR